jgi:hypothetical protein
LKKTGTHGGARRGAGAKPGSTQQRTVEKKAALTLWRERVEAELDPIITAQLELAKGLFDLVSSMSKARCVPRRPGRS